MTTTVQHLVGGEWTGDPVRERHNPARPGEVAVRAPAGDKSTVDAALSAAEHARRAWAATPAPARGAILLDAADLLRSRHETVAADLVREEGKTLAEARGEVRRAIDVLRYFGSHGWQRTGGVFPSGTPGTSVFTRPEPLGVVGLITPWNFPIAIPAWKLAPALVSGNTVVLKPAELTPASATHLAAALVESGLPAGVLNVVHGKGSVLGAALAADERVRAVSFTGSTEVGLRLHRTLSARRARVQLEMGGKNAYLVLDDADPAVAARTVAAGAFGLTGQACTATSRVYCTPGIRDEFVAALVKEAERFSPGDGLEDDAVMGPVVSSDQLSADLAAIGRAREQGATIATGGTADGPFLPATVLTDVDHEHDVARHEVFGPVVAVIPADGYDEGLALVNDSSYGLTAGLCTRDLALAHHFAEHAEAGVVKVNRPTTGLDLNVPFGGVKDSSSNTFREQGPAAADFYTWSKTIYLGHDRG
ncbi:aldehyde dehydrogenase family protein [Amycolatopsis benzoatilytica]|uniref:aldehyde dehydrogenase family protein n=1 Tax=Amycolatopsis benzoatilytica TaxID=346045 RepID=UPI00036F1C9E|nr:aldehyde dehydrogenase family protein [Amycolatopsis benzoatilytica]